MKNKSDRRVFLKNIGVGSAAALLPVGNITLSSPKNAVENDEEQGVVTGAEHQYNDYYSGAYLNRVAFPIGGLGAGMFCMEGTGAISHVSVLNRPEIFNEPGMFAAICVKGIKNGAKLLEGPVPDWKKFGLHDAANGLGGATTGLPHFHNASFKARFPFAYLNIADNDIPLKVEITGWSPFIPQAALVKRALL